MTAPTRPMTIEEFGTLLDDGNRHELVRGELCVMPPSKGRHGLIEARIIAAIEAYLNESALLLGWTVEGDIDARESLTGCVGGGDMGLQFTVPDDPEQVRGADIAYISPEQLAGVAWPSGEYFPAVPSLLVEVVSKTDRPHHIAQKVQDYLAGGARRVWVVYPELRAVYVHDSDHPTRVVGGSESLTDEELLPGFSLPLKRIFSNRF